ncbi:DUF3768 domain-containing protein [Pseudomonas putida]|uniref:DUF3768 domain-containing protein n=1 Tax=Pseudomonas putida TaxID=303 RepID=UPI001BB0A89B|nr:DUF3768 domain-containing protein [Pseudomonas putida]QUG90790.1 DUF3768 domain-containing protein [Pseudomonas putida]
MDRTKVKTIIQQKNDNFRKNLIQIATQNQKHLYPTPLVQHLYKTDIEQFCRLLDYTMTYKGFNDDNDPWNEHDMAFFEFEGERYFFKFDYYDANFKGGVEEEDRMNDDKCKRVLTIGLAEEY